MQGIVKTKGKYNPGDVVMAEGIPFGVAISETDVAIFEPNNIESYKDVVKDMMHMLSDECLEQIITRYPYLVTHLNNPSLAVQKIAVKAGYTNRIKNPHPSIELMKL